MRLRSDSIKARLYGGKLFSGPFRFLDLPPEIRFEVYRYLLLHGKMLDIRTECYEDTSLYCMRHSYPTTTRPMLLSLLRLNKEIYQEVADAFYGQKTFKFTLGYVGMSPGHTLFTITPNIVKRLTQCFIIIHEDFTKAGRYSAVREWLDRLTSSLAGAEGSKLNHLRVELKNGTFSKRPSIPRKRRIQNPYDNVIFHPLTNSTDDHTYQYILEPLVKLHGIQTVGITGHVANDFAAKLTDVLTGDGKNKLKRRAYVSRRVYVLEPLSGAGKRWRCGTHMIREETDPEFDWDEYMIPEENNSPRHPPSRS